MNFQNTTSNGCQPAGAAQTKSKWQICVDAVTPAALELFATWRGYSIELCRKLKQDGLIGMFNYRIALPITNGKDDVIGCHHRPLREDGTWAVDWFGVPGKLTPLTVNDPGTKAKIVACESQWDLFACLDLLGWHNGEFSDLGFIATRGAMTGARVGAYCNDGTVVYALPQNDDPGQEWVNRIVGAAKCEVRKVQTPKEFKDLNDWKRAGATVADLGTAIENSALAVCQGLENDPHSKDADEVYAGITPQTSEEQIFEKLATLPPLFYDRLRQKMAKKLQIRTTTLDEEVKKRRQQTDGDRLQGGSLDLADVEQWPDAVSGVDVLDEIAKALSRYVVLPDYAADAMALWTAHAHCFESFVCSPRLNISSPDKGCGKSTLRDVSAVLLPRPLATENLSVAVLFRVIEAHKPTVLADECDAWLKNNEELRGMLNAGHKRGGKALRCEGDNHEVRAFNVFTPTMLCGIGALPGTLHDRSIVIYLERAKPSESRERFDSRSVERETELCRKLARWCADNVKRLESYDPKMPDGCFNRLADNWRPLFTIAEIAGGSWPQRAANAFAMLARQGDADSQGDGVMLLEDIRSFFSQSDDTRVWTAFLCGHLNGLDERPYLDMRYGKGINGHRLGRLLGQFKIKSRKIRLPEDKKPKQGYDLEDFKDAFGRYLPPSE